MKTIKINYPIKEHIYNIIKIKCELSGYNCVIKSIESKDNYTIVDIIDNCPDWIENFITNQIYNLPIIKNYGKIYCYHN